MIKKKVLVTGAGGFIGKSVMLELIKRGYNVHYFDLIEPQKMVNIEFKRLNIGTILNKYDLSQAMRKCDYVIHLAAILGVNKTDNNSLETLYINMQGTMNVIEACISERIKKIIFISSSEVYGDQRVFPIKEDNPLNPKSIYAISKIIGEEYLKAYREMYSFLKYNIIRLFNVYGEYQREDFVISRFIKLILNDKQPTIYGTGDQIRSFCYVLDAARGIVNALELDNNGEIFNIGDNREPISIKNLAHKLIDLSNKKIEPIFVDYKESDRNYSREIDKRIPSIEKAKRLLNYEPHFSLDYGLKKIIDFYKSKEIMK